MAAYYAVFGGEYSVFDLRRAGIEAEAERVELTELRQMIDSLGAWSDSLQHDSATLERVARERFGLIREGETLYRFAPSDSVGAEDSVRLEGH